MTCTCGYGGFHEPENPRCALHGIDVTPVLLPTEVAENLPALLEITYLDLRAGRHHSPAFDALHRWLEAQR